MKEKTLKNLYLDQLRDLYDAENRLTKALPKMAKAASSEELRSAFEAHLEQTRGHVERLKEIFASLDEKASGEECHGMVGLLKEADQIMDEDYEGAVMDAALISAAQRVEHYEIAAYGCVRAWAEQLGETEAHDTLEKTLSEEEETDQKLTELAEQINAEAEQAVKSEKMEIEETEEEEEAPRKARKARA